MFVKDNIKINSCNYPKALHDIFSLKILQNIYTLIILILIRSNTQQLGNLMMHVYTANVKETSYPKNIHQMKKGKQMLIYLNWQILYPLIMLNQAAYTMTIMYK